MSLRIFFISSLFFVFLFGATDTLFAQVEREDSMLQRNIEREIGKLTNYDFRIGSGVGYIIFNVKGRRINVIEANCSNTELYKRLRALNNVALNMHVKKPKKKYIVCISYISENGVSGKLFWNNNEYYDGLHDFQWGKTWKKVTVLKPISVYTNSGHE